LEESTDFMTRRAQILGYWVVCATKCSKLFVSSNQPTTYSDAHFEAREKGKDGEPKICLVALKIWGHLNWILALPPISKYRQHKKMGWEEHSLLEFSLDKRIFQGFASRFHGGV
jgi:hypothetical protein